jgi:hypothetical protein
MDNNGTETSTERQFNADGSSDGIEPCTIIVHRDVMFYNKKTIKASPSNMCVRRIGQENRARNTDGLPRHVIRAQQLADNINVNSTACRRPVERAECFELYIHCKLIRPQSTE